MRFHVYVISLVWLHVDLREGGVTHQHQCSEFPTYMEFSDRYALVLTQQLPWIITALFQF